MTVKEIIDQELRNKNAIYLLKEGMFFRAYNRSAMFMVTTLFPYKVHKKWIKKVNEHIYYCGFPEQSLPKVKKKALESGYSISDEGEKKLIISGVTVNGSYENWQKQVRGVGDNVQGGKEWGPSSQAPQDDEKSEAPQDDEKSEAPQDDEKSEAPQDDEKSEAPQDDEVGVEMSGIPYRHPDAERSEVEGSVLGVKKGQSKHSGVKELEIIQKLRSYQVVNNTPIETMQFVTQLQKDLAVMENAGVTEATGFG